MPTMMPFITDADGSAGAVPMTAAQTRTRFPDVHVIHAPAVALASRLVLNPTKLCRAEDIKESQIFTHRDSQCVPMDISL